MIRPALIDERNRNRRFELSERATTLLEVMLVSALSLLLTVALLGMLDNFSGAGHGIERRLDSEAALRTAMAEVTRDIRAADPLIAGASSAEMATTLELELPASGAVEATSLRLRVDERAGTLTREVLSIPGGRATSSRVVLDPVVRGGESPFRYFDSAGNELVAGKVAADRIAACAVRVHVTLAQTLGPTAASRARETSVTLRNSPPEEGTC